MWYTVQPGDSLYSIARRFGTTVDRIKQANNLTGDIIFVGQRLFVPVAGQRVTVYVVQPGDTLYLIARKFNTTAGVLMAANNLTGTLLLAGQRLIIPLYIEVIVNVERANIRLGPGTGFWIITFMNRGARLPVIDFSQGWYRVRLYNGRDGWIAGSVVTLRVHTGDKPVLAVLGFYTLEEGPTLPSSWSSFVGNTSNLSEVALFMFRIDRDNPVRIEKFGDFTDRDVQNLVAIAHRNNIKILPVVHNLLYRPGDQTTSKEVVRRLVATPENRRAFAENLVRLIEQYNFDGVNIDIEDVYMEDSDRLSQLYVEIGNVLRPQGYFFSASIPSRVSDQPWNPFSAPFNYDVIGRAVDQFVVMLYNEHGWPGSGPGPVVSIGWMDRVLNYTITKMPREKIVASVSVFGFDFNVTTGRNTYVTYAMAVQLAQRYNKQIIFDQPTQTPMFTYNDENGNYHEVWFEDTQSILAKMHLAWNKNISGIGLWRLGMEDPSLWPAVDREIIVKKL